MSADDPMRVSELIRELRKLKKEHGDVFITARFTGTIELKKPTGMRFDLEQLIEKENTIDVGIGTRKGVAAIRTKDFGFVDMEPPETPP